jgi:hypothetical protein
MRIEFYQVETERANGVLCCVSTGVFEVDGVTYRTEVEYTTDEPYEERLLIEMNNEHPQLSSALGIEQDHLHDIIFGYACANDDFFINDKVYKSMADVDDIWGAYQTTDFQFGFCLSVKAIDLDIVDNKLSFHFLENTNERFARMLSDMLNRKFANVKPSQWQTEISLSITVTENTSDSVQ